MSAEPLDVLVVGGGVVGAGTALDLVSRGLRVGLVEARDWASGTSGRTSKLIHGGLARVPGQPSALPHHRHLALRSVKRVVPGLATEHVVGAVQYYDAETD